MTAELGSHRGFLSRPTGATAVNFSEAEVEPKPRAAGPPIPLVAVG